MSKLFRSSKSYGLCIAKVYPNALLTGTNFVFQIIGGPITVYNLGFLVTTATPAGANTLKFQFTPLDGTATDLCGTTDTASADAQQLFIVNGTKATGIVKTTDVGILAAGQTLTSTMPIILGIGKIKTVFSGTPATGTGLVFMEYSPLSQYTKVQVV